VRWQQRSPHPLIDLGLFANRSFTWGSILATAVSFGLFGLLFAVPQFFQAVGGANSLGTGVRLLPLIGGMVVGTRFGAWLVARAGARPVLVAGFSALALGLAIGSTTGRTTGYAVTGAWIGLVGAGLGTALPSAMNAALGTLPPQRAGSGAALISALRQAGSTIGVAILGTILNSGYHSRLGSLNTAPINESVSTGVAVAKRLGQPATLQRVQTAFVHGMDLMLLATAIICALGAVAAVAIFPCRSAATVAAGPREEQPVYVD
jgi:predicted MFS family arabinose efflux permease